MIEESDSVSQRKYTLDLLKETWIGCRFVDTLVEFNVKLGNLGDKIPIDK